MPATLFSFVLLFCLLFSTEWVKSDSVASFYDISANDINNNLIQFGKYKDNVVLVVNVASRCGYTDVNYKTLQQFHERFNDQGLRILAFPCNQVLNALIFKIFHICTALRL